MRVGDRIEARYRGRSKYYKGKISRVRADGTCVTVSNSNLIRSPADKNLIRFDVAYDDGEAETRVEERLIRSLDGGGRGSRSPSPRGGGRGRLREGAKIEARYRGRSRYYPGRIARDRGDGSYDVDCKSRVLVSTRVNAHAIDATPSAKFTPCSF